MSPGYPTFPLRRGDVYMVKLPYTEKPNTEEPHPALILQDEKLNKGRVPFTVVAYGTSSTDYFKDPFALPVDPSQSLKLTLRTFFLAHRLHAIDKDKYLAGTLFLGRLPKALMDRFDELLVLSLQIGEYRDK